MEKEIQNLNLINKQLEIVNNTLDIIKKSADLKQSGQI
jgi:hypothetical protein